jgi:hypothetical protein
MPRSYGKLEAMLLYLTGMRIPDCGAMEYHASYCPTLSKIAFKEHIPG